MDENTVLSLLESISSSEPLRKKFLEALRDPVQQNDVTDRQQHDDSTRHQSGDTVTPPVVEDHHPGHRKDHGEHQHGINAPLGAGVPQ